ncbi:hypothetical protein [uncultured Fibrella sp.]|uniref:hypothetical protein n=1 Tax=uncultured Fibrella sp. TaxID=1284596 RepID=UPI0035CA093B
MKSLIFSFAIIFVCLLSGSTASMQAQTPSPLPVAPNTPRVSFMLKNTLGYHRMFLAQGPGIAYGFTMGKRETTPKSWPVGTNLYFSQDGETPGALILTISADDEGKMLTTGTVTPKDTPKPANEGGVAFKLHNTSLLPRKITLVSYAPGETGNGTTGFMLATKGNKSVLFPVGTKLYIANSDQVDVVMSGKRIDAGKPFMVVKKEDAGRVINLD